MKFSTIYKSARLCLLGVVFGSLIAGAYAQSAPQPTAPPPAEIVKPAPKMGMDMKPMMMDMHNQMMGMKPSGNADVDFAMMMKMHHEGAITMAETQLKNGKDGQMRTMARDIIRAQKKEISAFDKFLAKHGDGGIKMGNPMMPTIK